MSALVRHLGVGLALGLLTGAVARGFMALLTEDPQFSWSGTTLILTLFALAGVVLAATRYAKVRGGSRWWKLLSLPAVLLLYGQGAVMAPGVAGLALVMSRRRLRRSVGATVLVAYAVLIGFLLRMSEDPITTRTIVGVAVMLGCCWVLAVAARTALIGWAPKRSRGAVASREAERDGGDGADRSGDGRPAEDVLDLHDRRVEQRPAVGLVGQGGDGGVVLVQPDRRQ